MNNLLGSDTEARRQQGAQAQWPNRPVTLVCPWGAGGGTDATARIVAAMLEKSLGQPVNVVNRTGGSGVVGHAAIASATPDGYTMGIITSEICMLHWQGLTQVNYRNFTPLGLMNNDPAGIQVAVNSPHRCFNSSTGNFANNDEPRSASDDRFGSVSSCRTGPR